jgi:hypothetical protein
VFENRKPKTSHMSPAAGRVEEGQGTPAPTSNNNEPGHPGASPSARGGGGASTSSRSPSGNGGTAHQKTISRSSSMRSSAEEGEGGGTPPARQRQNALERENQALAARLQVGTRAHERILRTPTTTGYPRRATMTALMITAHARCRGSTHHNTPNHHFPHQQVHNHDAT